MRAWFLFMVVACAGMCALAFSGCAHDPTGRIYITGCEDPEHRAAKHGTVLECRDTKFVKHGHTVTRCLVSTEKGDEILDYEDCE